MRRSMRRNSEICAVAASEAIYSNEIQWNTGEWNGQNRKQIRTSLRFDLLLRHSHNNISWRMNWWCNFLSIAMFHDCIQLYRTSACSGQPTFIYCIVILRSRSVDFVCVHRHHQHIIVGPKNSINNIIIIIVVVVISISYSFFILLVCILNAKNTETSPDRPRPSSATRINVEQSLCVAIGWPRTVHNCPFHLWQIGIFIARAHTSVLEELYVLVWPSSPLHRDVHGPCASTSIVLLQ